MELLAGCGSIDLIDGAEWIRGCGALGASDLYPIREAAKGGCISWSVRDIKYVIGGNYKL